MTRISTIVVMLACAAQTEAQSNPLPAAEKVKNYLPHMSWPEVEALARRTDMVIIPVGSLEQHGHQLPIGTDILNGIERAKLVPENRRARRSHPAPRQLALPPRVCGHDHPLAIPNDPERLKLPNNQFPREKTHPCCRVVQKFLSRDQGLRF